MRGLPILLATLIALAVLAPAAEARPNVLLIVTDDQRATGTMKIMPKTRRVFGRRGTRFTQAHATTPWCCPSRASIFSGLYAHNHGIDTNDGRGFDDTQTWQRRLHDEGYVTGIVGKYLNGVRTNVAPHFDYRREIRFDDPHEPELIGDHAEDFLNHAEHVDDRRWALTLTPSSPHGPFTVEPKAPCEAGPFNPTPSYGEADLSDKHPEVSAEAERVESVEKIHRGQLCELQATDEMIGRVVRILRRLDEHRNTLAIFMSDNGYLWGEHRVFHKTWPYRESTQIPLYMRWPGKIARRTRDRRLVANIDVAPTIYHATGIAPGYPVDGRSLLSDHARSELLIELPEGGDHMPVAWSGLLTPDSLYVEWAGGFVESYGADDPWQMEASNEVKPARAARLATARGCSGTATCP